MPPATGRPGYRRRGSLKDPSSPFSEPVSSQFVLTGQFVSPPHHVGGHVRYGNHRDHRHACHRHFAFGTQVNAILPSTTPVGTGSVTVTYNNQTSTPAPIQVAASAFGIYTYNSSGSGQAIATDTGYQMNTIIHTFHPAIMSSCGAPDLDR